MFIRGCAALLLLITAGPTIVNAQYNERQCTSVLSQMTEAQKENSFRTLILSSRRFLTFCNSIFEGAYTVGLESLAHGLNGDNQYTEALGVANQCIQTSATDLPCIYEKAQALVSLNQLSAAKVLIERSPVAITELDVSVKRALQDMLNEINASFNSRPPERSTITQDGPRARNQKTASPSSNVNGGVGVQCFEAGATGTCADNRIVNFDLAIYGEINSATVEKVKMLFNERRLHSKEIQSERYEINSRGGSVSAAMEIGRMFRSEGAFLFVEEDSVCISACVLILAGAVDRMISSSAQIGIHRPYLGTTPRQPLTTDQVRNSYTAMLKDMRAYLHEMNVSERLADDMLATEPERVRILTGTELSRYGLAGVDPAEQRKRAIDNEVRDVQEANKLGLDRREYTRRKALGERQCAYTTVGQAVTDYSDFLRCKQKILLTGQR